MKPGADYIGIGVFALISNPRGEILLIRHKATEKRSKEYESWWSMPGGTVEFGETLIGALRREIEEELSLSICDERFLNYNDYIKEGKHWLSMNFSARTAADKLINNEPEKISNTGWFPTKELPENLSPYTRECLRLIAKIGKEGM